MLVQVSREMATLMLGNNGVTPDALTSDVPTFPCTVEKDEKFISLLQLSNVCFIYYTAVYPHSIGFFTEHARNSFVITYVARLWGIVGKHDVSMNPGRPYDPLRSSAPPPLHSFR